MTPERPAAKTIPTWRNVPAKPISQTSAGVCGMHGSYIGSSCPKCVTQVKP